MPTKLRRPLWPTMPVVPYLAYCMPYYAYQGAMLCLLCHTKAAAPTVAHYAY